MRNQVGLAIVSLLALVCVPCIASAGCPAYGGVNVSCDATDSSIETCVNAIWEDFRDTAITAHSLEKMPDNPAERIASMSKVKTDLPPAIRLLGIASDYGYKNFSPTCDATRDGIEGCEDSLRSARHGLELLTKPELVAHLSLAARERLTGILRQHEAQYKARLDQVAASGQGEPSELCNATYASVASCERAVTADRIALRNQVFPVFWCGQFLPGKFVTVKNAAEYPHFSFDTAVGFYRNRLQEEAGLLEKARQTR
jgi:hypothetical protein